MSPRTTARTLLVMTAAGLLWGCGGDSPTAPRDEPPVGEGSIVVVTATAGQNLDPDGYEVALDGGERRPVGINDTVTFSEVPAGSHTLELSGFAETCHPARDLAVVNVSAGAEANAQFEVACMGIPDHVALVFASNLDGVEAGQTDAFDIYGAAADGTGIVNLTNHPALETDPAWSPNGTRLVFARALGQNLELYVVNADGTGLKRLTDHDGFDGAPAWSPDGSKIAFQRSADVGRQFGAPSDIFVMNADGSDVRNLTDSAMRDAWPSWSPDGSRIVFERSVGQETVLFVMNADGTQPRRLSPPFAANEERTVDREPAWSPDGGTIAFRSLRDLREGRGYDLWAMNADGTGLRLVLTSPGPQIHTAWTSDGRILFTDDRDVAAVRPNGGGRRTIVGAPPSATTGWPKWRP